MHQNVASKSETERNSSGLMIFNLYTPYNMTCEYDTSFIKVQHPASMV